MYSIPSRIRYSEVDEDKNLRIVSLVNYLQDCSTFQSEDLGVGVDHLRANSIAWVLMAAHIEIDELPRYTDKITTSTWCYEIKRLLARRNFSMVDETGKEIVRGDTMWTMFSTELMKACSVPESELVYLEGDEPLEMGPVIRKLALDGEAVSAHRIFVAEHHLDTNRHVNNAQYIQMALDALDGMSVHVEARSIASIDSVYKLQAHLGDEVHPRYSATSAGYTVSLDNTEGSPFSIVRFTLR